MNIAMIGTGYVGLVSGACLADFGHNVTCVDADPDRIKTLEKGELPFYEPGLAELVERQRRLGRLRFTTSIGEGCEDAPVIFLAVGTPDGGDGAPDLSQVLSVAAALVPHMHDYRVVVTKSTVPVGTGRSLQDLFRDRLGPDVEFDVVSNPEFLREGSAVSDFMRPDRVVIGTQTERAAGIMREIYRPLYLIETPIVMTTIESAEMVKYASNAFLAVKISFMNEIANLCDRTGSDVHVVAKGMGLDKRIGSKFLHPGPGYGGSCFPKDTRALSALGRQHGVPQRIVDAAIGVNARQRDAAVEKITAAVGGLRGKEIALLGLAFKPNTSDVREAPGIYIARELAGRGASVRAYDPVAMHEAAPHLAAYGAVSYAESAYAAATGADAVVIVTEWNEFRSLDLQHLRTVMRNHAIVDLRNVLDPEHVVEEGFTYVGVGRTRAAAAELATA